MSTKLTPHELNRLGVYGVLDALADGVYVTDTERRILFWNDAASRITGWKADEILGRTCYDNVLVHVDHDGHQLCGAEHCPLHRAIVTGETSGEPLFVFGQHRNGHRVPVEVTVAPLRDATGQVIGGIETFRDLTQVMDDLHRARVIQDSMVESAKVDDARLRVALRHTPHGLVSGDFHRVQTGAREQCAFFVADVMGHGLASALYTMQLRVLWDDALEWLPDPARLVAEINRRLEPLVSAEGYFATAVLVLVDPDRGELQVVRAGHSAPLFRSTSGEIELLGRVSPALGLQKDARFLVDRRSFGEGDAFLLYTDGAVETGSEQAEDLGIEGLKRLVGELAPQREFPDLEVLERSILQASDHIRLPDDLTLLSVTRTACER
jgi:PAS domain S-box-containing protein